jgi:hypothetical protein
MTQASLWQTQPDSFFFSELCAALYQREINLLAKEESINCKTLQSRLRSLPHYISMTAHAMMQVDRSQIAPLVLDTQNASWSAKQAMTKPLVGQDDSLISAWYLTNNIKVGLVVPVLWHSTITLDCIDRMDARQGRVRTNVAGWFDLNAQFNDKLNRNVNNKCNENFREEGQVIERRLLKPNKKVMIAACAGHTWQAGTKVAPVMPNLRELLLSCSIDWKNFKKSSFI